MVSRTGPGVSCYRVWQPNSQTEVERLEYPLGGSVSGTRLQEEIGLLRIHQEIHKEYKEKLKQLETLSQKIGELEGEIAAQQLPLVLVEGKTDIAILETAWSKLNPDVAIPFLVRSADPLANVPGGGSGGAGSLAQAIESIHPADNRHVVAVFDHDQKGLQAFDALSKNFKALKGHPYEKRHANGYSVALTLAIADDSLPTVDAKNLCVEYLFDNDVHQLKDANGRGLEFKEQEVFVSTAGKKIALTKDQQQLFAGALGDLSAYRSVSGDKKAFAENIVPTLEADKFFRFEVLFDRIKVVLGIES